MGKPVIKILDPIHCRADKEARRIILPALRYTKSVYRRRDSGFGKEEQVVKSHLITGRIGTRGHFLTGLLPRILEYCKKRGLKIKVKGYSNIELIEPTSKPKIKGIKFREDQLRALEAVKYRDRGKIVFPTGSGKTVIALGIMSMFPDCRILFLCHTKDLLIQSRGALLKHFDGTAVKNGIYALGAGWKSKPSEVEVKDNCIVIATIQSFVKWNIDPTFFDIVIVDEVHHVNDPDSQYGKILQSLLAPRRYGLTATVPTKKYEILVNEGLFGPTIAELTEQEGQEAGIVANVDINLVPIPYDPRFNKKCKGRYKEYYENCIVKNRHRNILLTEAVKKSYQAGESTLIIVEKIKHGQRIAKMLKRRCNIKAPFVHGATKTPEREKVKKDLQAKKMLVVVCSRIWKEGINIPTLDHIVNAVGLKEEKAVLQALGRGLRTTKDKSKVKLTDFLDPYKYLAEHSILRMQVYAKKGWL